jgi:hypothetical protein
LYLRALDPFRMRKRTAPVVARNTAEAVPLASMTSPMMPKLGIRSGSRLPSSAKVLSWRISGMSSIPYAEGSPAVAESSSSMMKSPARPA